MYVHFNLFPKEAFAHAFIVNSSPAENEVLSTTPAKFYLQFNESIQSGFHSIEVLDSSGKKIPLEKTRIDEENNTILETDINESYRMAFIRFNGKPFLQMGIQFKGSFPLVLVHLKTKRAL